MGSLSEWTARQFDPRLNWGDVEWIKRRWGGKLVLKGILDAEDARLAADSGADALVVSNHGGRQLDGAPSTISALPAIVEAVGERIEVWLDSGIRSGQDVLKAIALGARGTMIGRPISTGWARWAGRSDAGAGDHSPRAGPDHGLLRPYRHPRGRPGHPVAGKLSAIAANSEWKGREGKSASRAARRPRGKQDQAAELQRRTTLPSRCGSSSHWLERSKLSSRWAQSPSSSPGNREMQAWQACCAAGRG